MGSPQQRISPSKESRSRQIRNLEGSVRSGAKPSRALCRGWRPHRSRIERAAATPEQRARFKAYDLRRSPGSNACTTFAVWHGMLLNGESRLLNVCAVNGLGVKVTRDNP